MAVCLCLLKTEIKLVKMCFCDSLYIKCIIQLFSHGLELKTKIATAILNCNTRIEIIKKENAKHVSAPKYRNR